MADYTLTASPILGGYRKTIGDTTLEEVVAPSIVSVSMPIGGEHKLNQAMNSAYGVGFPASGESSLAKDKSVRFLGMGPDQAFALFEHPGDDGDLVIAAKLGDKAYYTLQSDNWVTLRLSGPLSVAALQRICQIDLDALKTGGVARTVMEHMGATLLREGEDSFLLLSAWSTAPSFLHAVETSLNNVARS